MGSLYDTPMELHVAFLCHDFAKYRSAYKAVSRNVPINRKHSTAGLLTQIRRVSDRHAVKI